MTHTKLMGAPPKPDKPCYICGLTEWYLNKLFGAPVWRCGRCHPDPRGEK